jgi:hypothetical protein
LRTHQTPRKSAAPNIRNQPTSEIAVEVTEPVPVRRTISPEGVSICRERGNAPGARTTTGMRSTVVGRLKVSRQFSALFSAFPGAHEPSPKVVARKLNCSLVSTKRTRTGAAAVETNVNGKRLCREVRVMEIEGGRRTFPKAEPAARSTAEIMDARCDPANTDERLTESLWSSCFTNPTLLP